MAATETTGTTDTADATDTTAGPRPASGADRTGPGPTTGAHAPGTAQPPPPARLLRPFAGGFAAVVALRVVGAVAGLAPLLAVVEVGRVLTAPGLVDRERIWWAVAVGAAGLLVRLLLTAASAGLGHLLDARVQAALRRRLAAHLGRVPIGWLSGRRGGELAKLVGDDVAAVHPLTAHAPGELVSAFAVPAVSLAYLLTVDWRLTLITLAPVVAAMALVPLMMTPARNREQREFDDAAGRIAGSAVEFVQGIAVVKAFGGGDRAHREFRSSVDSFTGAFRRWVHGISPVAAGMQLALSPPVVLLVVLTGGTVLVAGGSLPPSDVLPFLLLGLGLTAPVEALGHGFDDLRAARAAVGRIREVLAVAPLPEAVSPVAPRGHAVELRGVRFGYRPDREVLRGVDLTLPQGTVTALVGPSGGGKSTLVRLLPRFTDPDAGSVRLGGVDLRELDARELHRRVSFVFQDVHLLRATVAENIALAVPHASREQVERAAWLAGIHRRVLELPRGYGSVVGEDARLSGGEAQRLALARALLADTPVLVLDEATAFADPPTERAVRRALESLRGDRTVLVIAHRLETVAGADAVAVLEDGVVVEHGAPADLLARDGRFAALWRGRFPDGTVPGEGTDGGARPRDAGHTSGGAPDATGPVRWPRAADHP